MIFHEIYNNQVFDNRDIFDISHGTAKEDELFDYVNVPDYLKERPSNNKEIDDYCL